MQKKLHSDPWLLLWIFIFAVSLGTAFYQFVALRNHTLSEAVKTSVAPKPEAPVPPALNPTSSEPPPVSNEMTHNIPAPEKTVAPTIDTQMAATAPPSNLDGPPKPAQKLKDVFKTEGPGFSALLKSKIKGEWTVDIAGSADSDTNSIAQAILNANDGDTIMVLPGIYVETLVINKKVTLVGLFKDNKGVIVKNNFSPPLTISGSSPTIKGIDFRQEHAIVNDKDYGSPAIYVSAGNPTFKNIRAISKSADGATVVNAEATFEKATLTGEGGLTIYDDSHVTCTECQISGNKIDGTYISSRTEKKAHLKLTNCLVSNNGGSGVNLGKNAELEMIGGESVHNMQGGLTIGIDSYAKVQNAEFSDNSSGLEVFKDGSIEVENLHVLRNSEYGIILYDNVRAKIQSSDISDSGKDGLRAFKSTSVDIANLRLLNNKLSDYRIDDQVLVISNHNNNPEPISLRTPASVGKKESR